MRRASLVGLVLAVLASTAAAGSSAIRGRVVDGATGAPVAGALVSAAGVDATTDADGRYELTGLDPGATDLVVIADGFDPGLATVTVGDAARHLDLRLAPATSEVIEVTGRAPVEAEPATYAVTGDEVRTLPGSGNDALKALQALPGVSRVPFGLAGLVLRGASPRDSRVYLDGIGVPILYHFGGLASFYPSAMLDQIDLQPGSFGAAWGRSQGGLVLLTSKAARGDRWRVASEVSLIDAQVRAEGPAPLGGAWSLGLRRSYVDAILAAVLHGDRALTILPRYWDGQLRYERGRPDTGRITALAFFSDDLLRFASSGTDVNADGGDGQLRYTSGFVRVGLRYERRRGATDLTLTPWLGYGAVGIDLDGQGGRRRYVPMGARAELVRHLGASSVSGGLDVQGGRSALRLVNEPAPGPGVTTADATEVVLREQARWDVDVGAWLTADLRVGPAALAPGLRVDRYGLSDEWVLDPRVAYAQELSAHATLRAALGLYHQPPLFADVDPVYGNRQLHGSFARQASLGVDLALPAGVTATVTGYASQLADVPVDVVSGASAAAGGGTARSGGAASISREIADDQFGSYEYRENVGRGDNHGVEVIVRRVGERWAGWLSYTWSRSLRTDDPARYVGWHPYLLDQPHVLTALGTVRLGAWQLGGRVRYASGNPYTPVAGTFYDVDGQEFEPLDGPLLSDRLPAFVQLDVRADRSWRRPWGTVTLFLDVQNATNRLNPEGVTYSFDYRERRYTRGLPVFPSLGVEYTP